MAERSVGGVDWYYEDRGSGRPVVLLHAFPVDSRLYRGQVEGLGKDCRVIVPDLPGFGRSSGGGPFTMKSVAERVHGLLKAIDALPCVIGGCSMGGYATFAFEREFPTDTDGLILIDTKAEGDDADQRKNRDKMISMIDRHGAQAIADAMMPKMLSGWTKKNRPELEREINGMMVGQSPETLKHALAALRDRVDRTELLPSISDPTLILVGAEDQATPVASAEAIRAGIRHAQLTVIADAGHLSPIEQPEAVNAAIRGFVAGIK